MKSKTRTGLMLLRAPSSALLAKIALEGLRRRSELNQQGEIPLSEAAALLGCDQNQVIDRMCELVKAVPDLWDWVIIHGEGSAGVSRRFTRRKASQIKRLMKLPEFQQVRQLPPHGWFSAGDTARILKLPPGKVTAWLAHCVSMSYLHWCTLVPPSGRRGLRWQREF